MATKKTYDDMIAEPRFQAVQKKVMETPLQRMMDWDLDSLFKNYWKGCPKQLKEYIYDFDSSDRYYCCVTDYVEDFLLSECVITESLYEKILTWMEGLKIVAFWMPR